MILINFDIFISYFLQLLFQPHQIPIQLIHIDLGRGLHTIYLHPINLVANP